MRYSFWHRRSGDVDASPAARDLGKKLLAEIDNAIRLGGPKTQVRRAVAIDGYAVEARLTNGRLPEVHFTPPPKGKRKTAVGTEGFVTWPTNEDGETAITASPRILLVGDEYRAVRKDKYEGLFPNVDDPVLGEVDGLGRAGNVDWHGDDGWVVSWYGPRTRYIDYDTPLHPWVFFKGKPLVDARDYIDIDATVLGAAVAILGGWPWLIVVVEEYFFARWEKVWAVKLRDPAVPDAAPTSEAAQLEADEDSFVYLDGRTHNDFNIGRHPWFFNPAGTEGRLLTEAGPDYYERIIRIVEADEEPGFAVERENLVVPRATVDVSGGYVAGTFIQHFGNDTVVKNRIGAEDLRGLAPPPYTWPGPDPDPVPFGPLDYTLDTDERARQCLPLLEDWQQLSTQVVTGELWQPIAVDYKANGDVVYAYGHIPLANGANNGTSSTDVGDATVNDFYGGDNSYTGVFNPYGGNWAISVTRETGPRSDSWAESYEGAATYVSAGITLGLRVGAIEVMAANASDRGCSATIGMAFNGGTVSNAGYNLIGYSNSTEPVICDGMGINGFIEAGNYGTPVMESIQISAQSALVKTEQVLFLLHMDLRNDSLFVVRETNDNELTVTQTVDHKVMSDGPHREHTESRSTHDKRRRTWLTEGWVNGEKVLEDTVVTVDTYGLPPVITGFTNLDYPSALYLNHIIGYCLEALVSPSQSPVGGSSTWSLPDLPAQIEYPRASGFFYTPYESASRSAGVPDNNLAYQLIAIETPTAQQYALTWAIEVEAPTGEIIGTSFPGNATSIKVKWHIDLDGVPHVGSWCGYQGRYAFSMPMPQQNLEELPFRFESQCGAGAIADRALQSGDPPVDHFSPIWVLAKTKKLLSF